MRNVHGQFFRYVFLALIFSLICTLVLGGCSRSKGRQPSDRVAPSVTSTQPSDGNTEVVLNSGFSATFSETMDANSLTATTVTLRDPNNQYVLGDISLNEQTLTFSPGTALAANTRYTANIGRSATDKSGNKLLKEHSWRFTTGTALDSTAPVVSSITPEDFAQNIIKDSKVTITFSELINPVTLNNTTLTVKDAAGNSLAGTITYQAASAVFTPDKEFDDASTYFVTITTAIKDMAKNPLAAKYQSRFTTRPPPDVIPPQVASTSPTEGEQDIATNQALLVTFNELIEPTTATLTSFKVTNPAGVAVNGVVIVNGTAAKFTPTVSLKTNTKYTVTLSTDITDLAKNKLATQYVFSFTTGDGIDHTPPSVMYVSPSVNETNVSNNNAVSITFSEPVDPATVTGNSLKLISGGQTVSASVIYGGNSAILRPARNFSDNTVYSVTATNAIKDLSGNALLQDFTWTFTSGVAPDTETPSVSSTYPSNSAKGVSTNGALLATFSEAMNAATLTPVSITLHDNLNNVIHGTVAYSGAAVTFTPTTRLAFDTVYTAAISSAVKDLAGNALATDYSWTFTTGGAIDTTPPRVVNTVPAAATLGAPVNRAITATFTEAMRPDSLLPTTFIVRASNSAQISGALSYSGTTATFTPDAPLAYSSSYNVTISKAVKDLSGNLLGTDLIWIFSTGSAPDTIRPTVTNHSPATAEITVITSNLNVEFSEPMEVASLSTASFTLHNASGLAIAGSVTATPSGATFTPRQYLAYDTGYTARLTTHAQDLARNPLTQDFVWNFTTALSPDLAPPIVATVSPRSGADRVANNTRVTATFSEPVACASVTNTSFTLMGPSGPVPGSISCSGATVNFDSTSKLATRAMYTATLTTAITDLSADAMRANFTWHFTTAPWTQQIASNGADHVYAIAADDQNAIYVTGDTDGNLFSTPVGSTDIFLTKIDADGTRVWSSQIGTSDADTPTAIAVDANGNAYVTGYTYGAFGGSLAGNADVFVVKYDKNGVLKWRQQLGTDGADGADVVGGITFDSLGNLYLAGYTKGTFPTQTQSGGFDIFVTKLDSTGQMLWLHQFGTSGNDLALALLSDSSDNLYLAGASEQNLSGAGSQGGDDAIVAKLDTQGNILWMTQFGTPFVDQASSVALDANSNIYLGGHTLGDFTDPSVNANADLFLAKLNNAGTLQWTSKLGSTGNDRAYGVATDATG